MDLSEEFPQDENLVYLNHAAVGPWPASARDAAVRFAGENTRCGARHYPHWLGVEQKLRNQLRRLINAESVETIALLKNTSEALSVIAYGLDWRAGDNIVLADQEFPSNRIVWESLESLGVESRVVPLARSADPEADLLAAVDRNTRLLTSSTVHYASGLRMDLARLGDACRRRDVLFCVDAIQSLGALPFDARAVRADFVAADGHKWMLGPEGLAVFYCRPDLMERLKLYQYGWHMVEHAGDYDRDDWQPARTARRFECGSPNMLGAHVLQASLSVLLEHGLESVAADIDANMAYLIDTLSSIPSARLLSPTSPGRRAGILTVDFENRDCDAIHRHLWQNDILSARRGGGIRFSPHFYHTQAQLERAVDVLKTVV